MIQLFAQSVANQKKQHATIHANTNGGLTTARVLDFVLINLLEFLGSHVCEDL